MDPTGGTTPTHVPFLSLTERLGPSWVRASSPTWKWQSRELWKPRFVGRPFGRRPQVDGNQTPPPKFSKRMVHLRMTWLFEVRNLFQGPKVSYEPWEKTNSGSIENMFFCLANFWTHADPHLISTKKRRCVLQIWTLTCLRVFGVFSGLQFAFLLTRTSSLLASTGSPSSKFFWRWRLINKKSSHLKESSFFKTKMVS